MSDVLRMEGIVEKVLFFNENNGYIVFDFDKGGELVSVVGELGEVDEGESLILEGKYESNQKYGLQFHAEYCERKLPETVVNIEKYLASGVFKGINKALAKKIVSAFGVQTLEIIETNPRRLMEIKGISQKKCQEIEKESKKIFSLRMISSFLSKYNVKARFAMKAYQKYGADTFELLKINPYIMCEDSIELEFEKADVIANSLNIAYNSSVRVTAGIRHILKRNAGECGHSCIPLETLADIAKNYLNISEKEFYSLYSSAVENDDVFEYIKNEREYVYLPEYYYAESFIAERISVLKGKTKGDMAVYEHYIRIEERKNNIKYESLQKDAIISALSENIIILTGGPGTGKTTTLNAVISIFKKMGKNVLLTAPTGRASKRMADLTGYEAKTIHRLLEVVYDSSGKQSFFHNERNPLKCDVLVIDEMSMVDVVLFESLLRAVRKGCKLVMVGDSDQLPSVGAGNLLSDLISSGTITTIHLKEIFRQSKSSLIITNAHRIVSGEYPDLTQKKNDFFFFESPDPVTTAECIKILVNERLPKAYGYSPVEDIQVLSPTRKGIIGTVELNKVLQRAINPPSSLKAEYKGMIYTFRVGDKVMQNKNNYSIEWKRQEEYGSGIFNGDIGVIKYIDKNARLMDIDFDGRVAPYSFDIVNQLELAYAITVHKSQGCEFEAVVIPVLGGYEKLYFRNLLYTAVTRAKKLLILIGTKEAVNTMVDNNRRTKRFTCLEDMLRSECGIKENHENGEISDTEQVSEQ